MKNVHVMFCCNEPDHGHFTGRVSQIDISVDGHDGIQINLQARVEPKFKVEKDRVKVSRRHFPIRPGSYFEWTGNWCWDSARMTKPVAADLLNYLRTLPTAQCEGGYTVLCDKWDSGKPFKGEDLG